MTESIVGNGEVGGAAVPGLDGPWDRLSAYGLTTFVDHGFFRVAYRNWHQLASGLYRSNQPYPYQIRRAADYGVRTVINLRGQSNNSFYRLEREACSRLGLVLVDFPIRSRDAPTREQIHDASRIFDSVTYPALMHCKSGADRTGLMSALYLLIREGQPLEVAVRQLSPRFGHHRFSATGILDHFFDSYRRCRDETGTDFLSWVDNVYDREAVKRGFRKWWF